MADREPDVADDAPNAAEPMEEEEDAMDDSHVSFDQDGNVIGVKVDASKAEGGLVAVTDTAGVKRHPRASPYGGITSPDSANESNMKGVVVGLVKEAGKMLFSGQINLLAVSLPVSLFEPRSYLEKMADTWFYPHFFDLAYAHYKAKNPEEGIKWLVAFGVAGVHRAFDALQKPFSPILGETFQATYEFNAAKVNLEQISHHPPVSAFSVKSIDDKGEGWHYFGCSEPLPSFKGNSIKTFGYGIRKVVFYIDGKATEIYINFPDFHIVNLMMGQLRGDVRGEVKVIDRENLLMASVVYGPNKITVNGKKNVKVNDAVVGEVEKFDSCDNMPFGDEVQKKKKPHTYKGAGGADAEKEKPAQGAGIGSRFGSYFKRNATPPSGKAAAAATATAAAVDEKPKRKLGLGLGLRGARGATSARSSTTLSRFEGSWVSHLDVDGVRYWTMYPENPIAPGKVRFDVNVKPETVATISSDAMVPVQPAEVLPSDVRFRIDVNALKGGDMDAAQRAKVTLEESQRHDAKERMAGGGVDV